MVIQELGDNTMEIKDTFLIIDLVMKVIKLITEIKDQLLHMPVNCLVLLVQSTWKALDYIS
jgi:hypothetical protein